MVPTSLDSNWVKLGTGSLPQWIAQFVQTNGILSIDDCGRVLAPVSETGSNLQSLYVWLSLNVLRVSERCDCQMFNRPGVAGAVL